MTCAMWTTNWPGSSARWAANVPSYERPSRPALLTTALLPSIRTCGRSSGLIRNAASARRGRVSHAKVRALRSSSSERLGRATNQSAQARWRIGTRSPGQGPSPSLTPSIGITVRPTFDPAPDWTGLLEARGRWSGSCRDSILRRHEHVMLEVACGMRQKSVFARAAAEPPLANLAASVLISPGRNNRPALRRNGRFSGSSDGKRQPEPHGHKSFRPSFSTSSVSTPTIRLPRLTRDSLEGTPGGACQTAQKDVSVS